MDQEGWATGTPDFLPYSLIKNSTFTGFSGEHGLIKVIDASLELRDTTFTNNTATAVDSSTILAESAAIKIRKSTF